MNPAARADKRTKSVKPKRPEPDTECLKENSLSFQICKKKIGILHRIHCQFTIRLHSQLTSNGNVITEHKNTKTVCIRCLFAHGFPRQLPGDQS